MSPAPALSARDCLPRDADGRHRHCPHTRQEMPPLHRHVRLLASKRDRFYGEARLRRARPCSTMARMTNPSPASAVVPLQRRVVVAPDVGLGEGALVERVHELEDPDAPLVDAQRDGDDRAGREAREGVHARGEPGVLPHVRDEERLLVRRTTASVSSRELRVVLEWFTELSRLVRAS